MKVLVTGAAGQLGSDVVKELLRRNYNVIASDRTPFKAEWASSATDDASFCHVSMDITDEESVVHVFSSTMPDAVIHCAAWTAVDAAEKPENHDSVWNINVNGTENIAKACKRFGSKMVYISSDYVFDGKGNAPWKPDCDDYAPLNVYGESKLAGEKAVSRILDRFFIVRISWAFGKNGNNFISTMMKLGRGKDEISVVCDQIGTPTYTVHLSRLLVDMIETDRYGIYHATNEGGYISWAELADAVFKETGLSTKVRYVTSDEYSEIRAKRPLNSRLDKSKLVENGFKPLPDWHEALVEYLKDINMK